MSQAEEQPSYVESLALKLVPDPPDNPPPAETANRRQLVKTMRPIERGVIFRGALAGALCGAASYLGVLTAEPFYIETVPTSPWWTNWVFYSLALGIAIVATIGEVTYLYYDAIRGAVALGRISGGVRNDQQPDSERLKRALVRAGLEIPDRMTPLYGIDPLQESSRWRLLVFTAAYKLKVSATNFAVKALLRRYSARVSGRSLGRSIVEIVAIPVFALWNAWVCHSVMAQARVRALGQLLADDVFDVVFPKGVSALSPALQNACFLAIREQVVRAAAFHHNMILVTHRFMQEATAIDTDPETGPKDLSAILPSLPAPQRAAVLEFFVLLCALDGKVWRWEMRNIKTLYAAAKIELDLSRLAIYRRVVLGGHPLAEVVRERMAFHEKNDPDPAEG